MIIADKDVSTPVATEFASFPPLRRKVPSAPVATDSVQPNIFSGILDGWMQLEAFETVYDSPQL